MNKFSAILFASLFVVSLAFGMPCGDKTTKKASHTKGTCEMKATSIKKAELTKDNCNHDKCQCKMKGSAAKASADVKKEN